MKSYFPKAVSYNRFVELESRVFFQLMSDGMGREFAYLSSHATNRYFIPNWGNIYAFTLQYLCFYIAISMLLHCNIYAFTLQYLCFCNRLNIKSLEERIFLGFPNAGK